MHHPDTLSRRLAALDTMYSGSLPGFMRAHGERVTRVREARAREGISLVLGERTTLPSSVVRRAIAIEALKAKSVVLFGDVDGLAAELKGVSVTVVRPDAPPAKKVLADVAVFDASDLALTAARLESALAAVGPSGTVIARLRWPFDRGFYDHVRAMGVKVIGYQREVDHALFPSGHVADGAGDLVLLSGAIATNAPELPAPRSGELSQLLPVSVDAPPYAWFDMDGLDLSRGATLESFARRVCQIAGRKEELSDVKRYDDKHILCWYDSDGNGFVAELTPEMSHLLVSFVPYDDALDHATMTAAFQLFADDDTRVRPRRTERTPERTVFA